MIATVYPYKPQNDDTNSGFKIEDVTDDPRVLIIYFNCQCSFSTRTMIPTALAQMEASLNIVELILVTNPKHQAFLSHHLLYLLDR